MFPMMIVLSAAKFWMLMTMAALVGAGVVLALIVAVMRRELVAAQFHFEDREDLPVSTQLLHREFVPILKRWFADNEELGRRLYGRLADLERKEVAMSARFGELGEAHAQQLGRLDEEIGDRNQKIEKLESEVERLTQAVAQRESDNRQLLGDWKADAAQICNTLAERSKQVAAVKTDLAEMTERFRVESRKAALAHNQGYRSGYDKAMARILGVVEHLPGPDALG